MGRWGITYKRSQLKRYGERYGDGIAKMSLYPLCADKLVLCKPFTLEKFRFPYVFNHSTNQFYRVHRRYFIKQMSEMSAVNL